MTQPYGGYGTAVPNQDHPEGTKVLILGILGLVCCGVLAPFAWVVGGRVLREIDQSGGVYTNRSLVNVGRILGIIGTVLLLVQVAAGVVGILTGAFSADTTTY